jgi:hypothetical protein
MDKSKYALRVTAGPEYRAHMPVPVNSAAPLVITTEAATVELTVHVRDYRAAPPPPSNPLAAPRRRPFLDGARSTPRGPAPEAKGSGGAPRPRGEAAATAGAAGGGYFATAGRASARYGLRFALTPRRALAAADVLLGNDFDAPVRALLPPGFAAALRAASALVDPGLAGDPYADRPFLYGPLASSANVLRVRSRQPEKGERWESGARGAVMELGLEEGADEGDGEAARRAAGVPDGAGARRKWFLDERNRDGFVFEAGRRYEFDFFNGYLDFNRRSSLQGLTQADGQFRLYAEVADGVLV